MQTTAPNPEPIHWLGARAQAFFDEMRLEFPRLRLIDKRHDRLSKTIDSALKVVTLGGQNGYLDRFVTVVGESIYLPSSFSDWGDVAQLIVLRHERIHLRQRKRLGMPLMAFLYLVPYFPLGLAYGRARLEWEAYQETLRATAEIRGVDAARDAALRRHIVGRFTGPEYGWMWPFPRAVNRWYDRAIAQIESDPLKPHDPSEPR